MLEDGGIVREHQVRGGCVIKNATVVLVKGFLRLENNGILIKRERGGRVRLGAGRKERRNEGAKVGEGKAFKAQKRLSQRFSMPLLELLLNIIIKLNIYLLSAARRCFNTGFC